VLGGARVGVPVQDLGVAQGDAGVERIGDRSMPQRVGTDVARDAGGSGDADDHPVDVASVDGLAGHGPQDERTFGALSLTGFEHPEDWHGDRHGRGLVALPDQVQDPVAAQGLAVVLDVLSLNDREAALLTGHATAETQATHQRLRASPHIKEGAMIVVRHGPEGCTADGGGLPGIVKVPSTQVQPVDSTGAGDTHSGVLLAELTKGTPVHEALRRANAAAALAVTRPGPASAPTPGEIDTALSLATPRPTRH
jgi:hypothetical protein